MTREVKLIIQLVYTISISTGQAVWCLLPNNFMSIIQVNKGFEESKGSQSQGFDIIDLRD